MPGVSAGPCLLPATPLDIAISKLEFIELYLNISDVLKIILVRLGYINLSIAMFINLGLMSIP